MVVAKDDNQERLLLKSENGKPPIYERTNAEYKDYSSSFKERETDFSKQFSHMYACRIAEVREILMKKAHQKWGDDVPIVKLADLEHQEENRCAIIGTLYKHQQWKPSILRELSEENMESLTETREDYCDEKDQPFLEDEMLRIKLTGDKVDIRLIITGVVCAIIGHKTEQGTFDMEDCCFPGCPPKPIGNASSSKGKLVLISSLDLLKTGDSLAISLLGEWISGMAGDSDAQLAQSSVVRVVISGNSVSAESSSKSDKDLLVNAVENSENLAHITSAIEKLDSWLEDILGHCCVTLMPGQHDPTNIMLPQKPLHRFMLRKSFRYANFKGASNPWIGKIGSRLIAGSSGQPIEDIVRVSGSKTEVTSLEWLEKTLEWRHLCPTAPDTLPSHPYYEKDLFILKECPDIYFVSNTEKFDTKLYKGEEGQVVRLICVPRFSSTQSVVLVNLDNLETQTISFGSH